MRFACLLAAAVALPAVPALADGIDDMCLKSSKNDKAICDCARSSLESQFRPDDLRLYEGATRRYAADTVNDGQKWDRSLLEAGKELGVGRIDSTFRTNPIKSAHVAALTQCQASLGDPSTRPAPAEGATEAAEVKNGGREVEQSAGDEQEITPDTPMEVTPDTPQ